MIMKEMLNYEEEEWRRWRRWNNIKCCCSF